MDVIFTSTEWLCWRTCKICSISVGVDLAVVPQVVLVECRNEGVFGVCGFVDIRSCWCVAVGAWVSVQIFGILSPKRRDGTAVLYGFVGIRSSWYVAVGG